MSMIGNITTDRARLEADKKNSQPRAWVEEGALHVFSKSTRRSMRRVAPDPPESSAVRWCARAAKDGASRV